MFDCLGRPSFFDQAVDLVMERVAAIIEEKRSAYSHNASCASQEIRVLAGNGRIMRFAPQLIREMAQSEARKLLLAIERRFVRSGKLEQPKD